MEIKPPKGEKIWISYNNFKGETICILTSKPLRDFYFLYEVKPNGVLLKLGKERTPAKLEEKFDVKLRMRA